jgi:anti-sigma-K factor RskA
VNYQGIADEGLMALVADGDRQALATLYNCDGDQAILVVYGLPQPPAGQVYQLWLIHNGQRDSGGLFTVDDKGYAVLLVRSLHRFSEYQAIGVTNEPAGGSPGPTGTRVLAANF